MIVVLPAVVTHQSSQTRRPGSRHQSPTGAAPWQLAPAPDTAAPVPLPVAFWPRLE